MEVLYGEACEIYTDDRYTLQQRDLHFRERMWMKLLKDYDCTILNHPRRASVVVENYESV